MEQKMYNGELRHLYNDIDKRLAVLEKINSATWQTHDREAKEHRKYVHDSFHDLKSSFSAIMLKLNSLPCEERKLSSMHADKTIVARFDNVERNTKAIWATLSLILVGWLTTAWQVLFKK